MSYTSRLLILLLAILCTITLTSAALPPLNKLSSTQHTYTTPHHNNYLPSLTADTICDLKCVGIFLGLVLGPVVGIAIIAFLLYFFCHRADPSSKY